MEPGKMTVTCPDCGHEFEVDCPAADAEGSETNAEGAGGAPEGAASAEAAGEPAADAAKTDGE
ncbi:MAG: hypothetical protein AAB613_03070 [Patescibacteria group bacterium]